MRDEDLCDFECNSWEQQKGIVMISFCSNLLASHLLQSESVRLKIRRSLVQSRVAPLFYFRLALLVNSIYLSHSL